MKWTYDFNFGDPSTYDISAIYAVAESCLAIMTSSGPALRPLFAHWFSRGLFRTTERYNLEETCRQYQNANSTNTSKVNEGASEVLAQKRTQSLSFGEPDLEGFPLQDLKQGQTRAEVGFGKPRRVSGSEDGILPQNGTLMTRRHTANSETESTTRLTDKETKE